MKGIIILTAILMGGCGQDDVCYGKRDLFSSPDGLRLTAGEHDVGWGNADCFLCHQAATLHEANCGSIAVDVGAIVFDPQDTQSCVACHGDNGVAAWTTDDASDEDTGQPDTGE